MYFQISFHFLTVSILNTIEEFVLIKEHLDIHPPGCTLVNAALH